MFKKLLCIHDMVQIGFTHAEDSRERYSIREYKCKKCGKVKNVDGRYDRYAK